MKKFFCSIGIIIGLVAVILAFVCFGKTTGHTESKESYGGDAYTGIQHSTTQSANNTHFLAEIVKYAGGSMLLISGLFSIAFFGMKLSEKDQETGMPFINPVSYPSNVPAAPPVRKAPGEDEWLCPNCGRINKNYVGSCGCGQKKGNSAAVAVTSTPNRQVAQTFSDGQWVCTKCNAINPKIVTKCLQCGEKKQT